MAQIDFIDGSGSASLLNSWPAPANRFANWVPDREPIGPSAVALGTGLTTKFTFRTDYTATFEIDKLPNTTLLIATRLKAHLMIGGQVTVQTGDTSSNSYTCVIKPGTTPEIVFSDRKKLRYTFRVAVKNTSAAPLLCQY